MLKDQIASLPDSPGVYRYYNKEGLLIYVGKAKSLKKRVSSYFTKQSQYNRKTEKLVSEIVKLEYTLANTEFDALLLENNLIKQNQPKYNILLKDDKTFPYLCILKERFPRIISTRKYIAKQGEYFGPYSSVGAMNSVLELVRQLYSIRTCSLLLSNENIEEKKFKVCLEFHIGNCKGPCEGLQAESVYNEEIAQARYILKGNLSIVEEYFANQMKLAAEQLEFEKAGFYKFKLEKLENFQTKSLVVNRKLTDIDVVTIASSETDAFINYLQIKEGAIIFSKNLEIKKKLDEPDEEILSMAVQELRGEHRSNNPEVFTNKELSVKSDDFENIVPQIGDKKKLVDLSLKNALYLKREREINKEERKTKKNEVLHILQENLRLNQYPKIIECFDNSNFQGTNPVAAMVRFVDGKPDKKGYRHFNIKTVVGPDDFASMKEIVGRRYKRIMEEEGEYPQLIIVDGGKGQLSSACEALQELGLYGKIPIVGIAKRLEEIYYPDDSLPLLISKKSPALLLIQRIRDEAHRFGITFHRLKRSNSTFVTELESIPGIGKKTADKLLAHFRSFKKIKEATLDELKEVVGEAAAEKILAHANEKAIE
ncbi:MAG: excinuclease ABC subunit C [Cytophagales bacterium]|jgi:excinuclease ABC subunit C|nr:excinuclease ABC subunit C [Cytophagales bacterium]MCA6389613.1 excinuclease ABC subunit C [Cytophagales bacterium]MCA6390605.1 excinuclease ABC subunit C [Cytophagales bacterium]MCA6393545.1 excinuclease ABC subunit C [Cytophagales bacterium]MCA6399934.1 excinuclease ABC subunit C [Cytophagales bacterium]